MFEAFGTNWSMQYGGAGDAGVGAFGLKRIDLPLWALRIAGSDSIVPMKSKAAAQIRAQEMNDDYTRYKNSTGWSEGDPRWHAVVIPWPYTPEEHAVALAERADGYF